MVAKDHLLKKLPAGLNQLFSTSVIGMLLEDHSEEAGDFEWMAGFEADDFIESKCTEASFENLKLFLKKKHLIFGHFSYDLKNEIENLSSGHSSGISFPDTFFFKPKFSISSKAGKVNVITKNDLLFERFITKTIPEEVNYSKEATFQMKERTSKELYVENIEKIKSHIHRGDIYEMNYCIEFFAEKVQINPIALYEKLIALTQAPFSVLYKYHDQWLICASPERFLKKSGDKLISQPIKGTRPRGNSEAEDLLLIKELENDPKEKSENVMIVDLVRNDLSKSAKKGSVKVEELFGIYSFKNVHQMISTISAELSPEIHPVDAIKNAFPMGSMTGAPKIRAMELAEEIEQMKRGLYSGAVGYFTPEMNFDFNVIIRSIQYNEKTGYLSIMVGSAITTNSDAEKEYEECLVKAKTLFQALGLKPKE